MLTLVDPELTQRALTCPVRNCRPVSMGAVTTSQRSQSLDFSEAHTLALRTWCHVPKGSVELALACAINTRGARTHTRPHTHARSHCHTRCCPLQNLLGGSGGRVELRPGVVIVQNVIAPGMLRLTSNSPKPNPPDSRGQSRLKVRVVSRSVSSQGQSCLKVSRVSRSRSVVSQGQSRLKVRFVSRSG